MNRPSLVNRLQRSARGWRHVPDAFWLNHLVNNGIWPAGYSLDAEKRLVVPFLGTSISKDMATLVVLLMPLLPEIERVSAHRTGIAWSVGENGVIGSTRGIAVNITAADDVQVFEEVLVREIYAMTTSSPCVVIDIGMNTGFASLFFAGLPNVERVYGFEPFPETYHAALANFAINPELSKKIVPFPVGIDATARFVEVPYHREVSTGCGIHCKTLPATSTPAHKVTIETRAAVEVFEEVRAKHPSAKVILKCDCEGSERDVIPALCKMPGFAEHTIINLETHGGCAEHLVPVLEQAGFFCFSTEVYPGQRLVHAIAS